MHLAVDYLVKREVTKNKKNIPECLIIDGKEIKDKITIAEKFNDFFLYRFRYVLRIQ